MDSYSRRLWTRRLAAQLGVHRLEDRTTPALLINEVLFNPPGTDSPNEYFEIRATAGETTVPNGTYFIGVEGDAGNPGDLQNIFDLSGLSIGSNGYLVLLQKSNTYATVTGASVVTNNGTATGWGSGTTSSINHTADAAATDIEDASVTFMLIQASTVPTLTDDIDSNNDGTPDGAVFGGWTVLDSVGVLDSSSPGDFAYGAINFINDQGGGVTKTGTAVSTPNTTAGYVGRIGVSTGSAATNWVASDPLTGSAPNWSLNATTTFPIGMASSMLNHIGGPNTGLPSNDPPTITSNGGGNTASITAFENKLVVTTVVATDPNDDPITYSIFPASPDAARFTINPSTGVLTFAANPDFENPADANMDNVYLVTVMASDATSSDSQDLTVTVNNVNEPPTFTISGLASVLEDAGPQSIPNFLTAITAGPTGETGTVSFILTSVSTTGGLTFLAGPAIDSSGTLTFTTDADANGSATFSIVAKDDGGTDNGGVDTSASQNFTINIGAVNDAPIFTLIGNQTVNEDAGAKTVPNFLTNLSAGPANENTQNTTLTISNDNNALFSVQPTIHGAGILTYTPAADANGSAVITVTVTDDGGTANGGIKTTVQTFEILVNPVNDAPTFTILGNQTINEDAGLQLVPSFLTAVSVGPPDESTQMPMISVSNNNMGLFSTQPTINLSTGELSYAFLANTSGSAVVTVTISDGGGTANGGVESTQQTFTITVNPVNDVPSFTVGANQTQLEDAGAIVVPGFITNINAGPNESLQQVMFEVSNDDLTGLFAVAPAIDMNGQLTYTLAPNANGVATVTVIAKDNGGTMNGGVDTSPSQTFTITVTAVNDAPSFTIGADQVANQNSGPQTVNGFLTNISAGPSNENAQMVMFLVSNDNPGLFATAPAIDNNGQLTFTPTTTMIGKATVTVVAQDSGGTADGGVDTSAPQTFLITVGAVNAPPSFTVGPNLTLNEDAGAKVLPNFLTNISPGQSSEIGQKITFQVSHDNTGLFAVAPAIDMNGQLTYTLAADANGVATVTVIAKDDGGTALGGVDTSAPQTFTITVTAINDAPTFTLGAAPPVLEDAGQQKVAIVSKLSAGPANEMQTVTLSVTTTNPTLFAVVPTIDSSGVVTYTLAPNANGTAVLTVTATDNGGTANGGVNFSSQSFTLTVTPVNDAPTFVVGPAIVVSEDAPAQVIPNFLTSRSPGAANESAQVVSYLVTTDNPSLFAVAPTIDTNGQLTYTLAADANGRANVLVTAIDDGGTANGGVNTSAAQSFSITVTPVNDAPRFTITGPVVSLEDAGPQSVQLLQNIVAGPADEAGQTVTLQIANSNSGLFSIAPALDATGRLTFTTAPDANGTATLTITATDSLGASLTQTVNLTVMPVNDPPIFTAGVNPTVAEDAGPQTIFGFVANGVAGPGDEATQAISYLIEVIATTAGLQFTTAPSIDAAGNLLFQTAPDSNGTATLLITASDSDGATSTQTATLTVTPVNDIPTAKTIVPLTPRGGIGPQTVPGVIAISPGAFNETSDPISTTVTVVSTTGSVVFLVPPQIDATGTLTYTARPGSIGTATLSVVVSDGSLIAPPVTTTISVDAGGNFQLLGYREFSASATDGITNVLSYNPDQSTRFISTAFPGTSNGTRTVSADFTGDGVADLVIGSAPGQSTFVQVIDGVTQKTIFSLQPFEASFTGGIFVAAGDLNGDRKAELVITPDQGGGPRVRIFDGLNFAPIADFFGIEDTAFRGGARSAVGDLNGDGTADLLVAAGFGGGPRIAGFDGKSLRGTPRKLFNDFFVFEQTLRNGVYVAVGDINGDGTADIIAGGGPGGGPRVLVLDGRSLVNSGGASLVPVADFFAGDGNSRGGIRVAVKNLDNDTLADLVTGAGDNDGSRVLGYLGSQLTTTVFPNPSFDFDAFPGFTGGVFVG